MISKSCTVRFPVSTPSLENLRRFWATTHPFAVTGWAALHTKDNTRRHLEENTDVLSLDADKAKEFIDDDMQVAPEPGETPLAS